MIPVRFEYEVAESVDHVVELLGRHGDDAKILAGGHSLIPLLKLRLAAPAVVVDVGRLTGLTEIREEADHISIGATVRHRELSESSVVRQSCGLLAEAAATIGDVQVRERGTIGGSVAHADPAGDLPAALVALDASFVAQGPNGQRVIPAAAFFEYYLTSALEPTEVLTEIRVPKLGPGWGWHYEKFVRRSCDWAIVGVAAAVRRSNGTISEARIGLCNMGPTPLRAVSTESALAGVEVTEAAVEAAAQSAGDVPEPPSDLVATPDYRRHLARVLTRRSVLKAAGN